MDIIVSKDALNGLTNYDELIAYAHEQVKPYESLAVTEEELSTAKNVSARMKKIGKAASDLRIQTEREHKAKIELTLNQLKEITNIFTTAADHIDKQVKEITNARKEAKRQELLNHFILNVGEAEPYISFADIEDPKWQNVSVSIEDAKAQIDEIIGRYKQDIAALDTMPGDASIIAATKAEFRRTKSLSMAIQYKQRIEAERALEEQRQKTRREAEDKLLAEKEAQRQAVLSAAQESAKNITDIPTEDEPIIRHVFWVKGRKNDFVELRAFLIEHQMAYGKAVEATDE